jgi:uncharacterized membrane protein YhhN
VCVDTLSAPPPHQGSDMFNLLKSIASLCGPVQIASISHVNAVFIKVLSDRLCDITLPITVYSAFIFQLKMCYTEHTYYVKFL